MRADFAVSPHRTKIFVFQSPAVFCDKYKNNHTFPRLLIRKHERVQ